MWNSKEYKKQEARPEIDMLPADFRKLGEAAQPLYQLLKANYTPHHRIIVAYDGVSVESIRCASEPESQTMNDEKAVAALCGEGPFQLPPCLFPEAGVVGDLDAGVYDGDDDAVRRRSFAAQAEVGDEGGEDGEFDEFIESFVFLNQKFCLRHGLLHDGAPEPQVRPQEHSFTVEVR